MHASLVRHVSVMKMSQMCHAHDHHGPTKTAREFRVVHKSTCTRQFQSIHRTQQEIYMVLIKDKVIACVGSTAQIPASSPGFFAFSEKSGNGTARRFLYVCIQCN